jgi:alpha-galactosidase
MSTAFVRQHTDGIWSTGNASFTLSVATTPKGIPVIRHLFLETHREIDWGLPERLFGPCLEIGGKIYTLDSDTMTLVGIRMDEAKNDLQIIYSCANGVEVTQYLRPSPDKPVWRSWVEVVNNSSETVDGITRFDAVNLGIQVSDADPQAGYVLGWMEGPRADAPGRPPLPFKYGGWIPKFLYGEDFVIPPPPAGGWAAPVYRLVQERLTKLPLRSGKRSTYENHPWVTVRDTQRNGGVFLGFEWSGTWKIDAEHHPADQAVTVFATSDANVHTLKPGETLRSPVAFIGLFAGEWDDAFNACRFYVDDEIIPKITPPWPTTLHVYFLHFMPDKRTDDHIRMEIDAAADAGFETTYVEAAWWGESAFPAGDFSIGLGDFTDSRLKFPMGLKGMSDYVHARGMNFGVWFEFERVDIRTANRGRNPWRPEWLVHQKGHPYRSWCQHVFMLCLGVKAAAEWALENLSWAIREYAIDYIMIDSNEWAVCDDPTHDHGPGDGEWAQTQGLYHVLRGLRERFPDLMLLNSSGGSQRADFAIARYSTCVHPHDNNAPSAKQRRFQHGTGCMYPNSYQAGALGEYLEQPNDEGWVVPQPPPRGYLLSTERCEWRVLNRLLGYFAVGLEVGALPDDQKTILKKANRFAGKIRKSTHGDRYVLAGPELLVEPEYQETDNWEAYQYISRDREQVVVYFYRCLSREEDFTVKLKGLDPQATYHAQFWRERPEEEVSGSLLMEGGVTCHLEKPRTADIVVLTRIRLN